MTQDALIKHLTVLINKYISSEHQRYALQEQISRRDFYVAKGVLDKINQSTIKIEQADAALIKEIAFNFS